MNLRDIIASSGIRQRTIARTLGAAEAGVSRWISGEYQMPVRYVQPLARLLGVSSDEILDALAEVHADTPKEVENA